MADFTQKMSKKKKTRQTPKSLLRLVNFVVWTLVVLFDFNNRFRCFRNDV